MNYSSIHVVFKFKWFVWSLAASSRGFHAQAKARGGNEKATHPSPAACTMHQDRLHIPFLHYHWRKRRRQQKNDIWPIGYFGSMGLGRSSGWRSPKQEFLKFLSLKSNKIRQKSKKKTKDVNYSKS